MKVDKTYLHNEIKAVIFDMDGILINSEPFWQRAEVKVFNYINVPMTADLCRTVMGMRIDEVVKYWRKHFEWDAQYDDEYLVRAIQDEVIHLIMEEGKPMEGVLDTLQYLFENNVPAALASSSSSRIINAVVNKLELGAYFKVVNSAENLEYGKPHPEIFIKTAHDLGYNPDECLVFEDSFYGVVAALAAKMKVIAIPENNNDKRFYAAHTVLPVMSEFLL